jgi:hypothetical protein
MAASGYLHPDYAASLVDMGTPVRLSRSGGALLRRAIAQSQQFDGAGPYPLFCCEDWAALAEDLASVRDALISATVVTDPFGKYTDATLRQAFDRVRAFKEHHVVDLAGWSEDALKPHHRSRARTALRKLEVVEVPRPVDALDTWCALYAHLVERHALEGVHAFSRESFSRQLAVPGLVAFAASSGGTVVGMQLWMVQGDTAYSHLTAMSAEGYRLRASYALNRVGLEVLKPRVRWVDLGAGAGASDEESGLTWFKEGWANARRQTFLCEKVLDRAAYDALCAANGTRGGDWFPAYRGKALAR